MAELEFHGVAHAYRRGPRALDDVNLVLTPGVTGLVGANGAGKSTLMRMAAGGLPPTHGHVVIDGDDLYTRRDRKHALSKVAWMPQNPSTPPQVTALEFVAYITWMRGFSRPEASVRARDALVDVGLEQASAHKLGSLSGGMVRRVWLAQALACEPEVLLLDEPSTGLDPRQRARMVALIQERTRGTVLLSSHLLEDVADLTQRVLVLDNGHLSYDGPPPDSTDRDWLLKLIPDEGAVS